jgi:AcrR family transcriptional regulator
MGENDARQREQSLAARVRGLYEDGLVPVREIARLCGVTERTLYKYAARGRWRKRYARRALHKGAGGRFIPQGEAGKATAGGLKALDPLASAAAETACVEAGTIANRAAARTLADHEAQAAREAVLREFETRARRLAALVTILKYAGPEFGGLTPWRG